MTDEQKPTNTLDPQMLAILGCPACDERPPLTLEENGLHCARCGRTYPIHDGIPDLLVEDAILPTPKD